MAKNNHLLVDFGSWAEGLSEKFLKERGYRIIDRNYRKPWGEIDIIAEKLCHHEDKENILVFVEIKASDSPAPVGFEPEKRVNKEKILRIKRAAQTYIQQNKLDGRTWQIDLITVEFNKDKSSARITHFKNVFI
jgi:putative endonuclease